MKIKIEEVVFTVDTEKYGDSELHILGKGKFESPNESTKNIASMNGIHDSLFYDIRVSISGEDALKLPFTVSLNGDSGLSNGVWALSKKSFNGLIQSLKEFRSMNGELFLIGSIVGDRVECHSPIKIIQESNILKLEIHF